VRIHARIRAERHLRPGFHRFGEVVSLLLAQAALLAEQLLRDSKLLGFAQDVIVVVDVHVQIGPMLDRQLDSLVIDQTGMLDGVDPRQARVLDALRSVRVCRDLAPGFVRLIRRHL